MSRYAIQLKKITAETKELYEKASPFIKALASKVMEPFMVEDGSNNLNEEAQAVQDLFNSWPADNTTERLAALTHVLTGYKPKLATKSPAIGRCYRYNNVTWLVVYIDGTTAYSINSNATNHSNVSITQNINNASYGAELSDYGAFAKELLATDGIKVYKYIVASFGQAAVDKLLALLNVEVRI